MGYRGLCEEILQGPERMVPSRNFRKMFYTLSLQLFSQKYMGVSL